MAHTPVLRFFKRSLLAIGILLAVAMVVAPFFSLPGCAIVHRYPAYRGRVLEPGTDKPIEGAGVLAVYKMTIFYWIERNTEYLGYQAVLTDKEGKFTVPAKFFFAFRPLASFDNNVRITIYKKGYANFSGGFHDSLPKHGWSDPELVLAQFPPEMEVTFWLPKLETEKEIREHDEYFSFTGDEILREKSFPPPGTKKGQFLPPDY